MARNAAYSRLVGLFTESEDGALSTGIRNILHPDSVSTDRAIGQ